MDTITLEQLQELFAGLRTETPWNVDGEMLWGYFFTSQSPEKLKRAAAALTHGGYRLVGIFKSEDEPMHVLHVDRVEAHTPETLFARNQQFEALATEFELEAYDGMDVNPVGGGEEEVPPEGEEFEDADGEALDDDLEALEMNEDDDSDDAVQNPELLAAIETLVDDQSDEAQAVLTVELQHAIYLVPVFNEPSEPGEPDSAAAEEDDSVQLLVCTDDEGAEFMPLFTDLESLQAWTTEAVSAMALHAAEAWDFILSQPECAGAVVNPGGHALPLDRTLVEFLKNISSEGSDEDDE